MSNWYVKGAVRWAVGDIVERAVGRTVTSEVDTNVWKSVNDPVWMFVGWMVDEAAHRSGIPVLQDYLHSAEVSPNEEQEVK